MIRRQELKGGRTKEQQQVCQLMHWGSFHKLVSSLKGLRGTFIFYFSLELPEKLFIEKVMFKNLETLQPALENILGCAQSCPIASCSTAPLGCASRTWGTHLVKNYPCLIPGKLPPCQLMALIREDQTVPFCAPQPPPVVKTGRREGQALAFIYWQPEQCYQMN